MGFDGVCNSSLTLGLSFSLTHRPPLTLAVAETTSRPSPRPLGRRYVVPAAFDPTVTSRADADMWCGKKCGAKGKTPSFIAVFAVITPHIIWRMKVGTGRSSAKLGRYVQILIPFRSGARASHQQPVGCGAKHVFSTSGIGGHVGKGSVVAFTV